MSNGTYDERGMSTEMRRLSEDVLADEYWASHLRQMEIILGDFDPGIAEELDMNVTESGKLRSIVRYCIPLFELYRAIDGVEPAPAWLAAMYLWQDAWRPLDNLIDDDGPFVANFREYNVSILRAWNFHSKMSPNSRLMDQFLRCLNDTLWVEENREARMDPSLIFQRARLYEVTFDSLPKLSSETRANFRAYINAVTIAHDFGDVVLDIKEGVTTFATAALKSIDPYCRLTSSVYQELQATSEAAFQDQLKKMDRDALKACWVTQRNIDNSFRWAFHS